MTDSHKTAWRQFYSFDETLRYANADLHIDGTRCKDVNPARLIGYSWNPDEPASIQLDITPGEKIGVSLPSEKSCPMRAIVAPSYSRSIVNRLLAERLGLRITDFTISPPPLEDGLGNMVPVIGEVNVILHIWRGPKDAFIELSPAPFNSDQPLPKFGILPDDYCWNPDLILLGRDVLSRIVTVLSKDWTLIGGDRDGDRDIPNSSHTSPPF